KRVLATYKLGHILARQFGDVVLGQIVNFPGVLVEIDAPILPDSADGKLRLSGRGQFPRQSHVELGRQLASQNGAEDDSSARNRQDQRLPQRTFPELLR